MVSSLITSDQTAKVPGHVIGESIRLTSNLIEYSSIQDIPGYLVTVDIEKSFHSVVHTFLCSVLKKFGFGRSFIRWVSIILNPITYGGGGGGRPLHFLMLLKDAFT